MIALWAWRILLSLIYIASIAGLAPSGAAMNWLVDAEVWLTNTVPDPILFAFLTGLMAVTWIVPEGWKLVRHYVLKKESARARLAQLRSMGVAIRNRANAPGITTQEEAIAFENDVVQWNADVIAAIEPISAADGEWFAELDMMPPPRTDILIAPGLDDHLLFHLFQMHDFRLVKLEQLITGEKGHFVSW